VRLQETHDSSHRSRCADSISGVRGSGLCADNEYDHGHHVNDFKQYEQHKWAPRAVVRYAKSEHESQQRLPQQSSEARADVVSATSHGPEEERPAERSQTGVAKLVQSVATGPAEHAAEHSEPEKLSAVEKKLGEGHQCRTSPLELHRSSCLFSLYSPSFNCNGTGAMKCCKGQLRRKKWDSNRRDGKCIGSRSLN
jgi:hypothetical protein